MSKVFPSNGEKNSILSLKIYWSIEPNEEIERRGGGEKEKAKKIIKKYIENDTIPSIL